MFFRLKSALALALLLTLNPAAAANNHPVVLVHGFLGFGPEQFQRTGFKYWGGFDDIAGHMRQHHGQHTVHVATLGSISSSWDRAAELYYQIKGGCVDYGSRHAARHAHARTKPVHKCWAADPNDNPNAYPTALYPAWDAAHPIHLIGHSQGGQTMRALIELLENGSPHGDEGGGALYQGGKIGWVLSATSIAAPHDGTSLRDAIGDFAPRMADMATKVALMANAGGTNAAPLDLGLEQFGLQRAPWESAAEYLERVRASTFWNSDNYDSAQWEMGPDGAQEFNAWVKTSPNVYYYSISNSATEAGAVCCNRTDRTIAPVQRRAYQYPRQDMAPLTKPYAGEWIVPSMGRRGMGSYTQSKPGRIPVDRSWFVNDGVVNTRSMRAPFGHPARDYDGRSIKGTWNYLQNYHTYDHFDVLGWPRSGPQAYPIYDAISAIIYAL